MPNNFEQWTRRRVLSQGTTVALCAGGAIAALTKQTEADESSTNNAVVKKQDLHPQEFRKMVALGESTTAGGWSTSPDRCWVSQLAKLINDFQAQPMDFVNSGIGANVISTRSPCYPYSGKPAANERLEKHVLAHEPDLLVISYGLNDARGGTPLDLFTQEMRVILHQIRQRASQ